jgi:putative DNA primase/helicase
MAANYDDVLREMQAAGLLVDSLEIGTGRTIRCRVDGDRETRGWYRLSEIRLGDEFHLIGAYGIWRGNDNGKISVKPGKSAQLSKDELEAIAARIKADTAKAAAQRKAEGERAAQEASKVWRAYSRDGHSDYLERKGVKGHGVRFHESGTIAIPMADAKGSIHGLQIIRGKDRGNKLEKQYWPKGLIKQGHYHQIGGTPRGVILIAEGYATAASAYEATGIPCAVAFDANNLRPVAQAIAKAYKGVKILLLADDDYRTEGNPGVTAAKAAALAVSGECLQPEFAAERPADKKGPTDFNDVHALEGLGTVRAQIEGHLSGLGWLAKAQAPAASSAQGGGDGQMVARMSIDDAVLRFWGTYGLGGKTLFDEGERRLVHRDDVMNLLPGHSWEMLRQHPDWRVARDNEIDFDPSESDPKVRCNLFGGWPIKPKSGTCDRILELLDYQCDGESNWMEVRDYILNWMAYPLQHPGAKMRSAIVIHGPQGTGKNLLWEDVVGKIHGQYAMVINQDALEDKHNDWASKKTFIIADEVVSSTEKYHNKNKLKVMVSGAKIRINPKHVAGHEERNCMNMVFLSNERMPLVLEEDDRRHCVIWVPPKLGKEFYAAVGEEIANGGVEAFYHFLLERDLTGFGPYTEPPMTDAKRDLIVQSSSSEVRFITAWQKLELAGPTGDTLPFCPCSGSHLYQAYSQWCEQHGERRRRSQELIGHCHKLHGWRAGKSESTWANLRDSTRKTRKLVVPSTAAIEESIKHCQTGHQHKFRPSASSTVQEWLTQGFFAFAEAMGLE